LECKKNKTGLREQNNAEKEHVKDTKPTPQTPRGSGPGAAQKRFPKLLI
jgi:hypothetical protein